MAEIELKDLTIDFGGFKAVDNVNLTVQNGEFVVYLGPSGCGKTTTLRCIAGLVKATSGDVLFDGKRVNELSASERNIAMVFQFVSLYPHLKIRENIVFPLKARGVARGRNRPQTRLGRQRLRPRRRARSLSRLRCRRAPGKRWPWRAR